MANGVYYNYYFVNESQEMLFYDEYEVEEYINETYGVYFEPYVEDYLEDFREISEQEYNDYIMEGYTVYESR